MDFLQFFQKFAIILCYYHLYWCVLIIILFIIVIMIIIIVIMLIISIIIILFSWVYVVGSLQKPRARCYFLCLDPRLYSDMLLYSLR